MKLNELKDYIINLYDIFIMKTEKRGISYGEILHIQNLNRTQLEKLEKELIEKMS